MKWAFSTEMAKSKKIPIYLESRNIFVSKHDQGTSHPFVSFSQEQLWLHRTSQLGNGGNSS